MQVLNFARSIHAPSPGAHEIFLRSNPSCIPKDSKSIFVEDVVTNLPYYTVNLPIKRGFFTCMIDEERIIGLRVCFMFKDDSFVSDPYFLDHFFGTYRVIPACGIVTSKFLYLSAFFILSFPSCMVFFCIQTSFPSLVRRSLSSMYCSLSTFLLSNFTVVSYNVFMKCY